MEGANSERASQRPLRAPRVNPKDQESRGLATGSLPRVYGRYRWPVRPRLIRTVSTGVYSGEHRGNQRLVARAFRDDVDAFSKLVQGSLWGILQVNFREDPMLWNAGIGRVPYKYGGAARSDESAITGT